MQHESASRLGLTHEAAVTPEGRTQTRVKLAIAEKVELAEEAHAIASANLEEAYVETPRGAFADMALQCLPPPPRFGKNDDDVDDTEDDEYSSDLGQLVKRIMSTATQRKQQSAKEMQDLVLQARHLARAEVRETRKYREETEKSQAECATLEASLLVYRNEAEASCSRITCASSPLNSLEAFSPPASTNSELASLDIKELHEMYLLAEAAARHAKQELEIEASKAAKALTVARTAEQELEIERSKTTQTLTVARQAKAELEARESSAVNALAMACELANQREVVLSSELKAETDRRVCLEEQLQDSRKTPASVITTLADNDTSCEPRRAPPAVMHAGTSCDEEINALRDKLNSAENDRRLASERQEHARLEYEAELLLTQITSRAGTRHPAERHVSNPSRSIQTCAAGKGQSAAMNAINQSSCPRTLQQRVRNLRAQLVGRTQSQEQRMY